MINCQIQVHGARVLVMGLAFKENCPDLRNTRVIDVIKALADFNVKVDVYDPWVDAKEAQHEYGIDPVQDLDSGAYDAIIIAVAHDQFKGMSLTEMRALGKQSHVLYDLKCILPQGASDLRL
jgi:UDP-N-acetyl-D-galactosamine dehydrogenase